MGSAEGGRKSAAKLLARDPDYYKTIGGKGGKSVKPQNRMFAKDRELAKRAGLKGANAKHQKWLESH